MNTTTVQENTIFHSGDIKVTNSRFIVGSQTYAMNGITSVKVFKEKASIWPIIICAIIGLASIASYTGVGFTFLLIALALSYPFFNPKFSVQVTTASGEARAYTQRNGDLIGNIVEAINQAMVNRG